MSASLLRCSRTFGVDADLLSDADAELFLRRRWDSIAAVVSGTIGGGGMLMDMGVPCSRETGIGSNGSSMTG